MVQKQYREPLHTLPIIYTGERWFVDIMCSGRQPPASNQGGGPTKRERPITPRQASGLSTDVARVGSRGGKARRAGRLPAPILANLIPHVPDPRPVRGAGPGAGEPERPEACCAVTVYSAVVWSWCDPGRAGAGPGPGPGGLGAAQGDPYIRHQLKPPPPDTPFLSNLTLSNVA